MSRRAFIRAGAGAALGSAFAVPLLGAGRARAAAPGALVEPPVLRSAHGVLDVTIRAEPGTIVVGGQQRQVLTYNGLTPGPTLVAHPGDTLRIRLVNALATPTNLHTHGLHVSGEGNADNVMVHVHPGEEFSYEIELPADHLPGTNWYHPHVHGNGAQQIFAGMAGMLVVAPRPEAAPPLTGLRDRVLVMHATEWDAAGNVKPPLATDQRNHVRLVNGQLNPQIDIAPGETQRWRLVNTAVNTVLALQLDGHTLTRIAADGNPFKRPVVLETLVLAPGQRADVLVTGGAPGTSVLRTLPFDLGFGVVTREAQIATLVCGGPAATAGAPAIQPLLRPFTDLRRQRPDVCRELAMTTAGGFGIDGKRFDPERVDQVCELGAVEQWTVRNPTGLPHPFHIHVNPFQVTHIDGVPVDSPSYEDTVLIRQNGGSVTFRTRFEDFLGRAVFHCHFVTHSDLGMMGIAEIVARAPGLAPEPAAPAIAGGVCRL
ncbi:MAG TPA: multicopper oxidase family protein [Solirubrobacteraceae bacterium]|nr:multicopper oxidase family protein [Solirubrobacteraceae bacterium]